MLMQTHEARLSALREELKRRGVDGFIVPISDEYMSEYVGDYAQRLAWLTGFGGSAGFAAVTLDHAAIFVDGRYTVQVREQVDGNLFAYKSVPADTLSGWLAEVCESGARFIEAELPRLEALAEPDDAAGDVDELNGFFRRYALAA